MAMISRTARAMSQTTPGLGDKFRLQRHATDQDLLGAARAFASDATTIKSDFLRYALPADFLDDFNEQIEDFDGALQARRASINNQVTASAAFDDELGDAFAAVRRLDAIVRNTYRDNPSKLAAWASARHVERAPRRKPAPPAPAQ